MIKIKLDKDLKDLNGNKIVFDTVKGETFTVRKGLCSILGTGQTTDFIRAIDLGLKIKNEKKDTIELSEDDCNFLKEVVKTNRQFIDIVKYQLTKELE